MNTDTQGVSTGLAAQSPLAQATKAEGPKVDRRSNLSYEEFAREYMFANRPVVVTDALRQWNAVKTWSPEFFKREYGNMTFTIEDDLKRKAGLGPAASVEYTMAGFIDCVLASTDEIPAPYFRNRILYDLFPKLKQDIEPMPEYFSPNWLPDHFMVGRVGEQLNRGSAVELYIGGKGGTFPVLHYDGAASHAFLMQIYGQKQFIVFAPDQEKYLYPSPEKQNLSLVNVEAPDLERFPLYAKAASTTFILEPGELLFIPSMWWHTTRMLAPCISISVNTVNDSNWKALIDYVAMRQRNPVVSAVSRAYLAAAGARRSWRDRQWRKRAGL